MRCGAVRGSAGTGERIASHPARAMGTSWTPGHGGDGRRRAARPAYLRSALSNVERAVFDSRSSSTTPFSA